MGDYKRAAQMKSIFDLEKRQQKSFGGFIRELGEKAKAKAMAQASNAPATLTMPTIGQLDTHLERELYGKGGKAKKKRAE